MAPEKRLLEALSAVPWLISVVGFLWIKWMSRATVWAALSEACSILWWSHKEGISIQGKHTGMFHWGGSRISPSFAGKSQNCQCPSAASCCAPGGRNLGFGNTSIPCFAGDVLADLEPQMPDGSGAEPDWQSQLPFFPLFLVLVTTIKARGISPLPIKGKCSDKIRVPKLQFFPGFCCFGLTGCFISPSQRLEFFTHHRTPGTGIFHSCLPHVSSLLLKLQN